MNRQVAIIAALLWTLPARAADVWTTPFPGVRMLKRTTSQPVVFWALVVDACAPGIRFRASAPSEGNRRTSSFGRLVGAQLAINGDFADHDFGLNVGNSQPWSTPDTTHSGNFSVGPNRLEMTEDAVLLPAPAPWVTEQLGGRWTLLKAGVPRYGIDDNGPTQSGGFVCAPGLRHPRTAIGLSQDKRKVVLVVADGRSSASIGMTCDELIDVFRELGAHDAMGLDGGGSSTLWQDDFLVNHPSDSTGERTVRNHLAIFAAGQGPSPHCTPLPPVEPTQAARVPGAPAAGMRALTGPLGFLPLAPVRLFDTRSDAASTRLVRSDGATSGPLAPARTGTFRAWDTAGVPREAAAAWLTVTAVGSAAAGFLRAAPTGDAAGTSTLNFPAGRTVANAAPVAFGLERGVTFVPSTEVHLVGDLFGAFAPAAGLGFAPLGPVRALDTRQAGGALVPGTPRVVDLAVPEGAVAVTATVTAVRPAAAGVAKVFPCGAAVPDATSLAFAQGVDTGAAVVSAVAGAKLCVVSTAATDLLVDLTGAFLPGGPWAFVPVAPERVLDTRGTATAWTGRVAAGQVVDLGLKTLPGTAGVVANVTALGSETSGFLTVFPCGRPVPDVSTLNFPAATAVGGLAVTALGAGAVCLASSARAHLVVDLVGAWVPAPAPPDAGVDGPGDAGSPGSTPEIGQPVPAPPPDGPLDGAVGAACASAPGGVVGAWLTAAALGWRRRRRPARAP